MKNSVNKVPLREVQRQLRPLILELKKEGRKNYATVNIARVGEIGVEIQVLLDKWNKEADALAPPTK